MKKILIGLLLLMGGFANAQIGIDLTEMIPAPDSGYMIITTGDEYPERGLQKYVKAADVLGLDTMFQQGDSLCLLFRHEESYRCFPVHREVRFEKVDEGLRVCWEQRDTVWDTRAYLHFPGTAGSYVRARSVNDFQIGDQDAEIEVEVRSYQKGSGQYGYLFSTQNSNLSTGYSLRHFESSDRVEFRIANGVSQVIASRDMMHDSQNWIRMKSGMGNDVVFLRIDDVESSTINNAIRGDSIENDHSLVFGNIWAGYSSSYALKGDIASFRFNDEYILFEESYGKDTLITNKGTVLDILGDVEWRLDTLGFASIDTSHHCEIIPLTDTRLISVEHIGDSVRYTLSDSTIFTVRDSFIPQENIIGWIDDRIPDTVFFAKTSTATKAIEFGDTLELKGGAININIPVEIDYFPATNQLEICWTEIELPDQGLQGSGMGSEFNEGGGQIQQLPADTIRLCDTIQLNDVYIDTVFHDGDSLRFVRNDGKTWAVRDSFRTDDEILDLIEMMNDPQWLTLDRQGNEITIGITEGNEVSFIDSVRTDADIAKVMRDSLPKDSRIIADPVVLIPCDSVGVGSVNVELEGKKLYPFPDLSIEGLNLFSWGNGFDAWNISDEGVDSIGEWKEFTTLLNINRHLTPGITYDSAVSYTISTFAQRLSGLNPRMRVTYTDGTNSQGSRHNDEEAPNWAELTTSPTKKINRVDWTYSSGGFLKLYKIKIEKGSTATPWTPHPYDAISIHPHNATATLDSGRLEIIPEAPTGWVDVHVDYGTYQDSVRIPFATLCDNYVDTFFHSGDSIHLTMNDGRSWVVPDLHFTEQEIKDLIAQESPVNHSWLLKDGGVPDNATDTVYREGVAVIEGEVYDRYMTGDQDKYVWDGESGDPVLLQYVQDQSGNDMAAQGLAPNLYYAIVLLNSENPTEFEVIQLNLGNGIVFGNYGQGNRIGEPDYLLGVDQFGLIKEVRPTSGIDTIIHLGDSVFFDFDDKTFTIRDSVRSDAEIISLIEANRIFQQLGRSGDFITLTDGGQVLDLHLKDVTHTGDSIRFHLSDGRILTTRDSSLSVDAVRDMILEEIPETVFYVKQGDVTAPVNWGDVVELENGSVNVNMPTKVKMIDSLNALEVCIWQVIDRTVVDTIVSDYVEFNGTNSSYGQRANLNAGIDLELPFSFRTSFSDLSDPEQTILSNGGETGNNQFVFRLNTNDEFIFRNGDRIIQFPITDLEENVVYDIELRQVNDSVGLFLDGVLKGTAPAIQSGMAVSQIARQSTNIRPFNGRLYEIKSANAAVPIDEGSGNRLYGTGDIEYVLSNIGWGVDTVIRVIEQIDTLFQCDTIYLVDRFISDVTFENDTLKISRNDGKLFEIEIQASGGDGIDTMYSTQDSLYIVTSTGRTLSAGVARGEKGDGLEYHWDGTRLGVRVENSGDPFVYVDLKGEKGDTGEDGREIELRVDSDIIQWRYVGDTWQTLIPLSALKGEKGDPGPGLEYHWDGTRLGIRKVGDSSYDYVDLKGEKGDPGDVVGDINIYKDDGVILEDRTAIIEEDNTLRFDVKEKAGFEIGHYSQDGNDSKLINHRTSDNSFMLEIQEIEKDTLWNSRILATSKGIGLRNHKSYGSSISYGTMGIDTTGSYILNLVKDNPGVLFAGRRQFLNRVTDDGHALWDTLGIQDVGITPADTARWGSGGGSDYTLVRDGYQTHLRDKDGVSKGFFQIGGTGGVEVYTQANNMYRIGINSDYLPQWSLAFSTNNALQLRRDNVTQSSVGFVGTGGISIQSTAGSLTIDGSAIGGTQSLSFSPSLAQTTLSGGGGSFRIVGGSNTSVSLSAGGVYTISSTAAGDTREIVRGGTNNDWIMMSGSSVGVIDRYVSGFSKSGNNITLNRTDGLGGVTFNIADGDSDPNNELQSFTHNTSTQTTTLSHSGGSFRLVGGTGVNISNTSGGVYTISNSGDLVLKTEALNSGTATAAVIYASSTTGTITLPSGVPNGTVKYVINNSGGSKTINRGAGQTTTLNSSGAFGFIYYNIWWPMREP